MSTTVTYKGETIATVSNNTKTLTTQGKYLEGDIVLTDVSGGGGGTYQTKTQTFTPSGSQQTATITPDDGYDALSEVGVTVNAIAPPYYDMSGSMAWLGAGATQISGEFYRKVDTLDNTAYNGWTPSTTAVTAVASVTLTDEKFTATDLTDYTYYLIWECGVDPVYTGTPTNKAKPITARAYIVQAILRRPNSWANIEAANMNSNASLTTNTLSLLYYYGTTTGSATYTYSASYGFYFAGTAMTISSTTGDTSSVTPKTPTLSSRTSTTYMSAANAGLIDQANTKWWIIGKGIYKVKRDILPDGAYKGVCQAVSYSPPLPTA